MGIEPNAKHGEVTESTSGHSSIAVHYRPQSTLPFRQPPAAPHPQRGHKSQALCPSIGVSQLTLNNLGRGLPHKIS
jgi:hypothetical protein